jgi:hypothetical protein
MIYKDRNKDVVRSFGKQLRPDYEHLKKGVYPTKTTYLQIGVEGFEPPNGGTKNRCLTTWRHPIT